MQQEQISLGNLPSSMRYSVTSVPAVEASSTLARFDSSNGNSGFSATGADQIRIRVKADGFMDSSKHYIFFKVNTTTAGANIDGDASSFFDRMTIESNGVLIEQIDRYALYSGIKRNWDSENSELIKACGESGADYLKANQEVGAFANVAGLVVQLVPSNDSVAVVREGVSPPQQRPNVWGPDIFPCCRPVFKVFAVANAVPL